MSQYLIDAIDKDPNVRVRTRTEVVAGLGDGRLEQLQLRTPAGVETVPAAALVVLIGAHPHTEWLPDAIARDEWGYVVTGPDATGLAARPRAAAARDEPAGRLRGRRRPRPFGQAGRVGRGLGRAGRQRRPHLPRPGARSSMARSRLTLVVLLGLPLVGLAILLAAPETDVHWEHHPSHFWLVLITAALNAVLAYATGVAARRRGDRRVHLVSLSFLAASGFLALHALATPGVLLDKPNLGFVIATPVGLVLASAFAVLSAIDSEPIQPKYLERALLVLLALWAVVCLSFFPEVDDSVVPARLSSEMVGLSIVGVACYAYAVVRYLDLYRERRSRLVLGFTVAFVLLAEAMVAVALGRNWHASWWEWHLLMLLAFAVIAVMAHQEGSEERFGRLYVDRGAQPVTVLFADLKGFTAFSEHNEPATVSRMLDTLFGAAIPAIERHNGAVDRLIGDAVFATFEGENHAERAARAALALQEETGLLAAEHPEWPRFRAGLNTGEASVGVLGTGTGRTYSAIGDTVNLGSRIEGLAPPGGVAISAETAKQLWGAVTEPLDTVHVKGREEPVEVLLLRGLPPG